MRGGEGLEAVLGEVTFIVMVALFCLPLFCVSAHLKALRWSVAFNGTWVSPVWGCDSRGFIHYGC